MSPSIESTPPLRSDILRLRSISAIRDSTDPAEPCPFALAP